MSDQRELLAQYGIASPSKNSMHLIFLAAIFGPSRVVEGDYPELALPVPLGGRDVKLARPGLKLHSRRSVVLHAGALDNQARCPLSRDPSKQCRFEL